MSKKKPEGKHPVEKHPVEKHPEVKHPEVKHPEVKHEVKHDMPHFKEGPEAKIGDRCKFFLPSTGHVTQPLPLRARGAGEPKLHATEPALHEGIVIALAHGEVDSGTVAYASLEVVVIDGQPCCVSKLAVTDVHLGDCEKI